jgi:probable rRNA maturation factor
VNIIDIACADDIGEPLWLTRVEPFLQAALEAAGIDNWELSVLFCGDATIARLNEQYRGVSGPTDVLSFSLLEDSEVSPLPSPALPCPVGDIAVSLDTLGGNARYFSVVQDEELKRLLVHGILHLSGLDHAHTLEEDAALPSTQKEAIFEKQEKLLHKLDKWCIMEKE